MSGEGFLKQTMSEFSDDDCMTLAAALAYYTVFSLPSVLLIVVYVAGSVWGTAAVQGEIQNRIAGVIGPGAAAQVQTMIANAAKSTSGGVIATVLGIAGLVFSATGAFTQLQTSLNRAWEVKPDESGVRSFFIKRFLCFLMIVGIGIVVLAALGASTGFSALTRAAGLPIPGTLVYAGEVVVSFFVFALLFGLIFKIVPDARIAWKDVKVGAAITALLFVIGKFLIGFYLAHSTSASVYGAAGSLALLLLWTYYSSIILLLGAEATRVWARRHGRRIEPEKGAVKVREKIAPAA
jgi:membrane protein